MEEDLRQSAMLSDEDAEYETAATPGEVLSNNMASSNSAGMELDREGDFSDRDASGEELDEDAEGEEDNDFLLHQQMSVASRQGHNEGDIDEEEEGDEDAEGEDYDQEEGVGAVKVKPGETDDDDSGSEPSDAPSAIDSDEEAPWEDAAGAGEDDEDSEATPANNCIFCKQDEENDPSEDFEAYLVCVSCGDNAHQQCARDGAAMSEENNAKNWKCPDCSNDSEAEDRDMDGRSADDQSADEVNLVSQLSDTADFGEELQRPQSRAEASTSPSALHEDSMDGSRTLRKRKSSSLEPDDSALSFRKRLRNQSMEPALSNDEGADQANLTEPRRQLSSRTLRLKVAPPCPVTVEKNTRTSLVLKIQVRPGNLKEILSRRKRDRRRAPAAAAAAPSPASGNAARATPARPAATPKNNPPPALALPTPFTSDSYTQPFYSFFDRETEDMKGKPYGGILTEAEADTSKTLPVPEDRRKFDEAKQKAEDEWRARVLAMQADAEVPIRKSKKSSDNASQIECIEFGGWEIDTWYAAPYPAEYSRNRVLYICEFCLKYMNSDYVAWRHKLKCPAKHPPGDEIYRHGSVSMFEVDGRKNPVYCQNLCLLAKLFLGSKTLYYDVEPFLFYVLCEFDECGYHFVGYFSKEKRASSQNNVSCILTLPIHQRKGYGNLLIDFSYLLTKVEEKTGSPEKPLSDMGLVSYRNYWRLIMCRYFLDVMESGEHKKEGLSVKKISDDTGMTPDDVISALEGLRALVRDPQTKLYAFRVDVDYCRQYVAKWEAKGYVRLKPEALAWTPYVMGRSNAVNFELGPPINTIAPREDDEAKVDEGLGDADPKEPPLVNGVKKETPNENEEDPLESTEMEDSESVPVRSIEGMPSEDKDDDDESELEDEDMQDAEEEEEPYWTFPYQDIPPTRFEIFPAVAGSRRDRSRPSGSRPSAPRTVSNSSNHRPKRSGGGGGGGSSHRPTPSRPKSSSKRKAGGTGRGPGRWPKGTKKSDYGNADSGPGLPPGWSATQPVLQSISEAKGVDKEAELTEGTPPEDSVVVSTTVTNGNAIEGTNTSGETSAEPSQQSPEIIEEDVDAEGEDV